MTDLLRPQPLGVFPLPAGYLVLPDVPGAAELSAALRAGCVPEDAPEPLRFYLLALAGAADAAHDLLAQDGSPEARYNRLVLRGEPADYLRLRGELGGDLALLLELVAYTLGWSDAPPQRGDAAGELAACVLSAHGAHAIERGDIAAASRALGEAAEAAREVSPLLAAQILGDLAELDAQQGHVEHAARHYQDALHLAGTVLPGLRAQLWMRLGMVRQEHAQGRRGMLLEAARCYQEALKVYTREAHPELYALAQNNLALAYLAMPLTESSDQLRMAIAVQALREALTVYTPAAHPEHWAGAQLNLANALQYLPSASPEDHLAEAVELYEALLEARDPASDPLGYARLLANQGNALAHLGIFVHARQKLGDARARFLAAGDAAASEAVAEVLATIDERERELAAEAPERPRAGGDHGSIRAAAV